VDLDQVEVAVLVTPQNGGQITLIRNLRSFFAGRDLLHQRPQLLLLGSFVDRR
jgi:hypothetical protein